MLETLKFGKGNWANKTDSTLAYSDQYGNFQAIPFDFTRATTATRVNKQGLIESVNDGIARIDYSDSTQGAFLLEPQRTNLITYSEDYSDSSWVKTNVDVSNNTELAPNGTETATRAIISSIGTDLRTQCNVIELTNYTFTFYAKKGSSTDITYRVYDVSNGSNIVSPTNYFSQVGIDWQRVELNFTTPSGCTSALVYLASDSVEIGDIYLWGAQLEESSYATSYIPTNGAIATRNGETCINATPEINSEEGVLYFEGSALADSGVTRSMSIFQNGSNFIKFQYSSTSNRIDFVAFSSGALSCNITKVITNTTENNKFALKWNTNDFALWVNGVEVGTDTSGNTPIGMDKISFTNEGGSSGNFFGNTKDVKVYPKALSDVELQTLTTI